MTFVNEKVPEQDIDKYGLREINEKHRIADYGYTWVIDRKRDIFLRYLCHGDRDDRFRHDFSFYWKGNLLLLRFLKDGEGVRDGKGSSTWTWIAGPLPEHLAAHREEYCPT